MSYSSPSVGNKSANDVLTCFYIFALFQSATTITLLISGAAMLEYDFGESGIPPTSQVINLTGGDAPVTVNSEIPTSQYNWNVPIV